MFQQFNQFLAGQPSFVLSLLLYAIGVVAILAGAFAAPALKVVLAAWLLFP